jgi:Fe-S cluster biogenesis protein NfuA
LSVQVFFLDEDAFNIGRPPYVVPVERLVPADAPERGALDALFAGPTADETAAGLIFVPSGATGITDVRVEDGTAHVELAGGCSSGGSTFTIADEIVATMRQFPDVVAVRIYDPEGRTGGASAPGDSIPECLEP